MVVKMNGIELYRRTNTSPKKYENVIVSHKHDIGESEYWGFDYEEERGEIPCADVFIKNFQLKSYDFQQSNEMQEAFNIMKWMKISFEMHI